MKYNELEVEWIADGIRAHLIVTNGTDRFPEEFYKQAKELLGLKDWEIINE